MVRTCVHKEGNTGLSLLHVGVRQTGYATAGNWPPFMITPPSELHERNYPDGYRRSSKNGRVTLICSDSRVTGAPALVLVPHN